MSSSGAPSSSKKGPSQASMIRLTSAPHTTTVSAPEDSPSPDRREWMNRHPSMGNVTTTTTRSATTTSTPPVVPFDITKLHDSWATSDTTVAAWAADSTEFLASDSFSRRSSSFSENGAALPLSRSISQSTTNNNNNSISSCIHDAARITNWDQVYELCRTHPEAAAYAGRDKWTALHHVCGRRCPVPRVAQALITAYPEALLLKEDDKGWLPLHAACRFKAPAAVVKLLIDLVPEKGRKAVFCRDRLGRPPLFYAIRYDAPPGVVGMLLRVDPSAVFSEDQNDDSPLALVWDSWAEKLEGKRIVQSFLPGGFPEPEDTTVEERAVQLRQRLQKQTKLRQKWEKVNMLLKAAFGFPVEEQDEDGVNNNDEHDDDEDDTKPAPESTRKWRIVHATAAVKCHLSLFQLACALHPEQVAELDECDLRRPSDGGEQTALHLAASSNADGEAGKTVVITLLSLYREAAQKQDGIDGSLPLHRMVENERRQDWQNAQVLYHFYPRAVQIPDHSGRLPLHRAAAAIKQDEEGEDDESDEERSVIVQLVRAFPQAAACVDNDGVLPMHNIAMNAAVWDFQVEAVYNAHRNALLARTGAAAHSRLPLHCAAANPDAQVSLIQRLLSQHPRGASQADRQGKLPLHLAAEQGLDWEVVRLLVDAFPEAVSTPEANPRGWSPLHLAAASPRESKELLGQLIQRHPDAVETPDSKGRYPLHLAVAAGKSWESCNLFFEACPEAMAIADATGLLPLHLAAFRYAQQEETACDDSSGTMRRRGGGGEEEKEHDTDEKDAAQLEILYEILRADPSTLRSAVVE